MTGKGAYVCGDKEPGVQVKKHPSSISCTCIWYARTIDGADPFRARIIGNRAIAGAATLGVRSWGLENGQANECEKIGAHNAKGHEKDIISESHLRHCHPPTLA